MEGGVVFLIFIHTLLPQFLLISARDSVTPTQPLSDNQTLVSSGETFELGFFSPTNSKNRYLGIWFKKISIQTVVWVANRDNPLTNSSGVLKISSNGNLVLVNQSEDITWSSSINGSRVENPIAQLLDSGNLVVKSELSKDEDPNSYIWQSFDYPFDNLIEGMKLGWNLKTGFNRELTSWKSFEDPSPGDFAYGMDPRGSPELVLRNGSVELFRTGPWNGVQFSGTPELKNNSVFEPIFVNNEDELYYTFKSNGVPVISRFSLNPLGSLQRFTWNERNNEWVVILTAQIDKCNTYGLCGAYGICNIDDTFVCKCLKGFVPKSPEDWDRIDWSSGCRRKTPWDCQNGDGFVKFDSVKLPDTTYSWVNRSILSLKECEMKCLENCSCNAYANLDIRGGGSGCVLWFGDLIDIREFTEGGGQDLYVRMAASELEEVYGGAKKKKKWAIMISISVILGTLVLCSIVWLTICKTRRRRRRLGEGNLIEKNYATESQSELDLPLFDFVTVATATGNFSFGNKLGQGGFGPVYKGELPTGQEIAVKRLSKNSDQGLNEFKNEVICIAKLQHRNLVRLLGCCIQREEMMLIYEYMPNKSLDYFIFDEERRKLLSWQKRFDIIIGVAQGLLYLHRDSRLRIIHRDLKASNVLLDSELNAKISDFGLARTFGGDQTQANTRRVVGTYGYLAPEYAVHGLFSMKSDVFSFGVLVLEIVSGKRNRGFYHPDHDLNLLGHAWKLWNEGKPLELADRELEDPLNRFEVLKCIQVGLLCVQHRPDDRPSMSSVILMLSSDATLPQPNQPGFYHERCLTEEGPSSSEKFFYENKVSVTLLEGR